MNSRRKELSGMMIGIGGALLALYLLAKALIPRIIPLPLLLRMLLLFATYWLIALVPLIVMRVQKDRFRDCGFSAEKLPLQLITGLLLGLLQALVLVLPPYLLGFGALWDNGTRFGTAVWRYVYQFFYDVCAIAAVEELVFRGFCMKKAASVFGSDWAALAVSSLLFGLFHFMSGSIVQMAMTTVIGAFWGFCRLRIRHCSLLSLIIAHGVYDFIIAAAASLTHI